MAYCTSLDSRNVQSTNENSTSDGHNRRRSRFFAASIAAVAIAPLLAACGSIEIDPGALPSATCVPVVVNGGDHAGHSPAVPQTREVCFTVMPVAPSEAVPSDGATVEPPAPASSTPSSYPGHPDPGSGEAPGAPGYVLANPQVTSVVPSMADPPRAVHREFQANCSFTHRLPDDPIVRPGQPGASHDHTFLGNPSVNALTTTQSLLAGTSACRVRADKSGYWMPTMFNGNTPVVPNFPQVIYYKSGVIDYTSVRPFPTGLRYVVGSVTSTPQQFRAATAEGWECGDSYGNSDFPAHCPPGTQLNVRFQAPSCWDGKHLDSPDHKSHMAYPVSGRCPMSHPVAVPMVEFKMAFPVSGDMSNVHLSSGRGYSWHYDFFNAWQPRTLAALVKHCVNGGLQCNARGYDEFHPSLGAALNENYELP